jgi:hypothetical protein
MKALKDSNADLPEAKMTDFRRHDKAAEYRQPAALRPQKRARISGCPYYGHQMVKQLCRKAVRQGE